MFLSIVGILFFIGILFGLIAAKNSLAMRFVKKIFAMVINKADKKQIEQRKNIQAVYPEANVPPIETHVVLPSQGYTLVFKNLKPNKEYMLEVNGSTVKKNSDNDGTVIFDQLPKEGGAVLYDMLTRDALWSGYTYEGIISIHSP